MPLFGSTKNQTTLNETLNETNLPVGVQGEGNKTIGAYGNDESVQIGAPIAETIGDEAFAPYFNFGAPANSGGGGGYDPTAYAAARPDLVNNWRNVEAYRANPEPWAGDENIEGVARYGTLENYLAANWKVAPAYPTAPAAASSPASSAPSGFDANAYAAARPDLVNNWNAAQEYRQNPNAAKWAGDPNVAGIAAFPSFEAYLRADWTGSPISSAQSNQNSVGQFGGAVQGPGVVAAQLTAPVSSGDDSVAQQITAGAGVGGDLFDSQVFIAPVTAPVTGGDAIESIFNTAPINGPVTGGDLIDSPLFTAPINAPVTLGDLIDSPQITAPISGLVTFGESSPVVSGSPGSFVAGGDLIGDIIAPSGPVLGSITGGDVLAPIITAPVYSGGVSAPIAAGGDIEIAGPVFTGVSGGVSITSADPQVARASIEAGQESLSRSLEFADRALARVADANRDPSEKTANTALWLSAAVGLVTALLAS